MVYWITAMRYPRFVNGAGANEVAAIDHEQLKELGINRIADAIEVVNLNLDPFLA